MATIITNSSSLFSISGYESERQAISFNGDHNELRRQYASLVVITILACLVFDNITVCTRALVQQQSAYNILGMLQACAAIPATVVTLIRQAVPWLIPCWTVGMSLFVALCIGAPIINCILMERAYRAHKQIHLAWFGFLLTAMLIATNIMSFWGVNLTRASSTSCAWTPLSSWVISKCVIDAVNGLFLSACYIVALRRRYKTYGLFSGVSKQSMRGSYYFSFAIIFSGIAVSLMMLWPPAVQWSTHLYSIQFVIASTLLVH
ncbi:hypothetical protein BDF19DRAFT_432587 [Syncephalis fuscata]|nr:hypothetical protein BDF19DRAFT_432587 [Syncephalis fuscata]